MTWAGGEVGADTAIVTEELTEEVMEAMEDMEDMEDIPAILQPAENDYGTHRQD